MTRHIFTILMLMTSFNLAYADVGHSCDDALSACIALSQEQDRAITQLKQSVTKLEDALVDSQKYPMFSSFQWGVIGACVGATGVLLLKH